MEDFLTDGNCSIRNWNLGDSALIPEVTLEGAILATAVILNLLLLATICCSQLLRTSTHIFISSLAVSDFLISCYGLIRLAILFVSQNTCFSLATKTFIDKGLKVFNMVNTCSGYMNIVIVSVERWLFISRPFLHQRLISRRFTLIGVTVAWASSLLVNLDGFIFTLHNYYAIADFKYLVFIPCIHFVVTAVICSIYTHLTIITRRQINAVNKTLHLRPRSHDDTKNVRPTDTKMKQLRTNLRSIRLLVTVFGGFVVLLSPGIYYHFYLRLYVGTHEHPPIHEGFKLMTCAHSCVNFIVFASLDRCFRRVLMTWLRKATCPYARCVGRVQVTISVCRRCRRGYKVGFDDSNSKVVNPACT